MTDLSKAMHRTGFGVALLGSVLAFGIGPGFERPKVWMLCLGASLLLPFSIIDARHVSRRVLLPMGLFAVVLVISAGMALDPARAWIGSLERSQGVWMWLALFALALAKPNTRWLIKLIQLSALVLFAHATLHAIGIEAQLIKALGFYEQWGGAFERRAFASLGNPNALGGWLCISLPLLTQQALKTDARILDQTSALAALVTLIMTGSRAAWLAACVCLVIALCMGRTLIPGFQWRQRVPRFALLSIAGLLICAVTIPALWQMRADSINHRLQLWQQSADILSTQMHAPDWQAIWLGTGADLQAQLLADVEVGGEGVFTDRAHNGLLDSYLSFGIIGVISMCWIMLMTLRTQAIVADQENNPHASNAHEWIFPAKLGLLAGVICWQFGFSLTAEKTLFAALLGMVLHTQLKPNIPLSKAFAWLTICVSAIAFMLANLLFAPVSCESLIAWRSPERSYCEFQDAIRAANAGDQAAAFAAMARAHTLDPTRMDYKKAYLRWQIHMQTKEDRSAVQ
jgi:hypothetical protein